MKWAQSAAEGRKDAKKAGKAKEKEEEEPQDPLSFGSRNGDAKEKDVLTGFRAVYVWDVSQTDGKPVPKLEMGTPVIDGNPERLFNMIAGACPVPVGTRRLRARPGDTTCPRKRGLSFQTSSGLKRSARPCFMR